jgi:predicted metal-dependent hydrolase
MKESLIISILILFIYIFLFMNKNKLVLIEANNSGHKFLVHDDKLKNASANLLSDIITSMYKLRNHLIKNIDTCTDSELKESIILLEKNLNETRTNIYENAPKSEYTSYSVNKGEEVVFCLKSRKSGELHTLNLLMYVAIHEMAHVGCHEIGHTVLFSKIFEYYTKESIKIGIYKYDDYDSNPVEYCGMVLSSSII